MVSDKTVLFWECCEAVTLVTNRTILQSQMGIVVRILLSPLTSVAVLASTGPLTLSRYRTVTGSAGQSVHGKIYTDQ